MEGPRIQSHSRGKRLRRFLLANLGAVGLFALVALAYFALFYRPDLINRDFPVHLPADITVGEVGETLLSGGLELTVERAERLRSLDVETSALSSRSQPGRTTDYLILFLSLKNTLAEPLPLVYSGGSQLSEFLIGSRRPMPDIALASLPRDAEAISGGTSVPNRALEPGETSSGFLVFPISRGAEDLSLLLIANRYRPPRGPLPSFEVRLKGV